MTDCQLVCCKDLSNQVKHWEGYTEAVRKAGKSPGMFLSPTVAEWMSGTLCAFSLFFPQSASVCSVPGLPEHWTDPTVGQVAKSQVDAMFPQVRDAA